MATLDFYKDLLKAFQLTADKDGLISFNEPDGGVKPATVDGMRLVLPTDKNLRAGFTEQLQPFHPLGESLSRKGVSPVLTHLQKTARALIGLYVTVIAQKLMHIAADPSLHKDLPPECSEYLIKVPNANEKTLKKLDRLIHKALVKNALLTVYLRNGGKYNGEAVSRICTIRFPIMDALDGEEMTIYGVQLTAKEKKTISALFHYILPFGDDPEEYSFGSNAKVAPFLDAFLRAYQKITTQLNKMVKRYSEPLDMQLTPFDTKFIKHLSKFDDYYSEGAIPPLRGNEGALAKGETESDTPPWETPPGSSPNTASPTPSRTPQPSGPSKAHKETMAEYLAKLNPPVSQAPAYAQHQGQQPGQPYPTYGAQQQQPQMQPYIPSWQQQHMAPQQPQNPFAAAVNPQQPTTQGYGRPAMSSYGHPAQSGGYNAQGGYSQPYQPQQGYQMPPQGQPQQGYHGNSL